MRDLYSQLARHRRPGDIEYLVDLTAAQLDQLLAVLRQDTSHVKSVTENESLKAEPPSPTSLSEKSRSPVPPQRAAKEADADPTRHVLFTLFSKPAPFDLVASPRRFSTGRQVAGNAHCGCGNPVLGRLSPRTGLTAYDRVMPLDLFHPLVADWFAERFGEPTEPQRLGWPGSPPAGTR